MRYEKVDVCGYKINVAFEEDVVRIKNDYALSNMLKNVSNGSGCAAWLIKERYREKMDESLNISVNSLGVEILGHVYPDKMANAVRKIPGVSNLAKYISGKTSVIDCGTKEYGDTNRWVWDLLAPFHEFIGGSIAG